MFQQSADAGDRQRQACCRIGGGRLLLFVVVLGIVLRPDQPAQAYLDPGSGAMLLQLLLGGVAGILVVLKLYWHRFTTFLRFNRKDPEATVQPPPK